MCHHVCAVCVQNNRDIPQTIALHEQAQLVEEVRRLIICIIVELIVSSLLATLTVRPAGSLRIRSCEPQQLADFYPGLQTVGTQQCGAVDCTSEVVYPLTTWVMLMLLFGLGALFCIRLPVARRWCPAYGIASIRTSLYINPLFAAVYMVSWCGV